MTIKTNLEFVWSVNEAVKESGIKRKQKTDRLYTD